MGKPNNIPVTMDDSLLEEIDRVAEAKGETRSSVMRTAIRIGLPIVERGSGAEAVGLDAEISEDVQKVASWQKWSRQRVLIEAIRVGLPAVHARWSMMNPENHPPVTEAEVSHLFIYDPHSLPLAQDLRQVRNQLKWEKQFIAQMRQLPEGEIAYEKVRTAFENRRRRGALLPLGDQPTVMSREDIEKESASAHSEEPQAPTIEPKRSSNALKKRGKRA